MYRLKAAILAAFGIQGRRSVSYAAEAMKEAAMTIVRSEVMGFCSGVRNAVRKVYEAVEYGRERNLPVYTIGPLIHNDKFLGRLGREKGVRVIHKPDGGTPGIAVIRAHGIPRLEREAFLAVGFELIDGTCRRVTRSQKLVRSSCADGRQVLIAGNPDHGEVQAIIGEAGSCGSLHVLSGAEYDFDAVRDDLPTLLISQTTFSSEHYRRIADELMVRFQSSGQHLEIIDSICPATLLRQQALKDLAERCEAMIVIGGRQSANTRRLFELARELDKPAWHIGGAEELDPAVCRYERIGITAGASTPDWLTDEVVHALQNLRVCGE